eukprot:g18770.t1
MQKKYLWLSKSLRSTDRKTIGFRLSLRIGLLLRTILLLLPWVGADWVFHLRAEEQRRCGAVLVFASMWLWTILLILELLGACALCWGAAVFAEHELSLRHLAVRGMETAEDNSP